MEKYFVTYNQSLALKELGFDMPCFGYYDDQYNKDNSFYVNDSFNQDKRFIYTSAPLKSQVYEFFREKYSIVGYVVPHNGKWTYKIISNKINIELNGFKTYEEAESACIDKLIEIIKNK